MSTRSLLFVLALVIVPTSGWAQHADQFDLASCRLMASPDVRGWPATVAITEVEFSDRGQGQNRRDGVRVAFDESRWPDFIPPGWSGPLHHTVWIFVWPHGVSGRCYGAAVIENWRGVQWTGAPLNTMWREWFYNGLWGADLENYRPQPGWSIGLMVTAGQLRLNKNVYSVHERSNAVVVPFETNRRYAGLDAPSTPPPTLPPPPTPPPTPTVPTGPSGSLTDVLTRLDRLEVSQASLSQQLAALAEAEVQERQRETEHDRQMSDGLGRVLRLTDGIGVAIKLLTARPIGTEPVVIPGQAAPLPLAPDRAGAAATLVELLKILGPIAAALVTAGVIR